MKVSTRSRAPAVYEAKPHNAVKLRKAPKGRIDTAQGEALGIQDKKS